MGENVFDGLRETAFKVVATTMGFNATWDGNTYRVLFREPSEEEQLGQVKYNPSVVHIEYQEGDFPGLSELVSDGDYTQEVTIKAVTYYVRDVNQKVDGRNYEARLERKSL